MLSGECKSVRLKHGLKHDYASPERKTGIPSCVRTLDPPFAMPQLAGVRWIVFIFVRDLLESINHYSNVSLTTTARTVTERRDPVTADINCTALLQSRHSAEPQCFRGATDTSVRRRLPCDQSRRISGGAVCDFCVTCAMHKCT